MSWLPMLIIGMMAYSPTSKRFRLAGNADACAVSRHDSEQFLRWKKTGKLPGCRGSLLPACTRAVEESYAGSNEAS